MNSCPVRPLRFLAGLFLLGLVCLALPAAVAFADGETKGNSQSAACSGTYYTVKRGDTWSIIARRVGISVAELKNANPQAVRAKDVIYAGEKVCIPAQSLATAQGPATTQAPTEGVAESGGYWRQVRPGDTWNTISRATGVPVADLWRANPGLLNKRQWLYIGQRVWIPQGGAPAAATAQATPAVSATAEAVMTATVETAPTAVPTIATPIPTTAAPSATPVPTTAATAAPTVTPAPSATPVATALPPKPADCPKTLADYDAAIARFLNTPGNTVDKLNRSLILCRVTEPETPGAVSADITGPGSGEVVVTINDATAEGPGAGGALLVFRKGQKGYAAAHKHAGQGRVELIAARDINADGKFDLVYSDKSCGAHTCFGTLTVDSWDGKAWADWIEDAPTIAEPEITVKDVSPDGQGEELILHGGVIGSVGAGPQRAWTETYISPAGEPYKLLSQVYDASACLYHHIIDANRAFDAWALDGFEPAIAAYQAALAEKTPGACGTIKDEVKTLQDFARFRLLVAEVAGGNADEAAKVAPQIAHAGLKKAAAAFLASYTANSSVIQACRDVTKLAEADPTTWQFLADWGYANPSFTAQELCPLN